MTEHFTFTEAIQKFLDLDPNDYEEDYDFECALDHESVSNSQMARFFFEAGKRATPK